MASSWRSSMAEQLICNQQVAGSNPIASSRKKGGKKVLPSSSLCAIKKSLLGSTDLGKRV